MNMKWLASLVFIAASTLALAADKFDFDVANVQILIDKAVQKEVGITEAQRTKLNKFADALNKANNDKAAEYQKAKKPVDAEFQKFGMSTFVTFRKNCLETLTPVQLKRLREITIQAAGPRALMDRTVAAKCGLTDPTYGQFMKAINEGDIKVAKIKSEVSKIMEQKYSKTPQPKTQKEGEALQKKIQADTAAEMKKREPQLKKVLAENDASLKKYVKQEYLDKLKALMGKPFNPNANPTQGKKAK